MVPKRLLFSKFILTRLVINPISVGMVPADRLLLAFGMNSVHGIARYITETGEKLLSAR
jgi:hypothetical protein